VDRVDGITGSDVRLTVVGPIAPPVSGQSVVTTQMVAKLKPHFARMRIADINVGEGSSRRRRIISLRRSVSALWSIPRSDAVYIAIKSHRGMWLTTAAAGLARLVGARVFLHHHSYDHVRSRRPRMVALALAAGPHAHHIVLSRSMASDLSRVMPEIPRPVVIGNAGFIDGALLKLSLKDDGGDLVLGHLSNLRRLKGIPEVVDLALALNHAGIRARLIVGGPTDDDEARLHIDRAARELGELFDYRGPIIGEAKRAFFEEITHFVFPSRDEAQPMVLYEAMAAGAICVATRQGSVAEQLEGSPSVLAHSADSFVEETLPVLIGASVSTAASHESRRAYLRALAESERQLTRFVELLAAR
jgi:glycosyltransferase involved in cell wall biosynthesis